MPLPGCTDDAGSTDETNGCRAGQSPESDAALIMGRIGNLATDANIAPKTFALEITPYQVLENFPRGKELLAGAGETDEIAAAYGLYRTVYDDIAGAMAAAEMGPAAREHAEGDVDASLLKYTIPVAVCSHATLDSCEVKLMDLGPNDVGGAEKVGVTTLDLLGALQDIALIAKDQIEIGAADCLLAEEDCEFDLASLRSVYAASAPYIKGDADRPEALTVWAPPANLKAAQAALRGDPAVL